MKRRKINDYFNTGNDEPKKKKRKSSFGVDDKKCLDELQTKMNSTIRSCHQILYTNDSIVGRKALNDIIKILTLKLLQPFFEDASSIFHTYEIKENGTDVIYNINAFDCIKYCKNIKNLATEVTGDVNDKWKKISKKILNVILSNIYTSKDLTFHCKASTLKAIILKIDKIGDIFFKSDNNSNNKNFNFTVRKYYDTISGNIYEYFVNDYLTGGGKELGQFFTPRKIIKLIITKFIQNYCEINLSSDEISVYDPCMGSGGFLAQASKILKIKDVNKVYGNEIEADTIKLGVTNLLLTLNNFPKNIKRKNSLIEVDNTKHTIILTNPPFGIKLKYIDLKKKYESENKNSDIDTFETIYPVKTNNGASLFLQHCVYKLDNKGICGIILPAGQLFYGKNFTKLRKWLYEQVIIQAIIKIPSGTFEHTGISTCAIIFIKNDITKKPIAFYKISPDKKLELLRTLSINEITKNNYSLDFTDYYIPKIECFSETISLSEICNINRGKRITKKDFKKNGQFKVQSGGARISGYYDKSNTDPNTIIIVNKGSAGFVIRYNEPIFVTDDSMKVKIKDTTIITNDYLFFILKYKYEYFLQNNLHGSIIPTLNINLLQKLQIPLLPLKLQKQISEDVNLLLRQKNILEELIQNTEKEIEIMYKYGIQAKFQTSNFILLKDICIVNAGKQLRKSDFKPGNIKVFGSGKKYIGFHNYSNIQANKILIIYVGSAAGYVHRINEKIYGSNLLNLEIISNDINEDYLYHVLKFQLQPVIFKMVTGAVLPMIQKHQLYKLKIPLLPLEKQLEHNKLFEEKQCHKNINSFKQSMCEIEELLHASINNIFTQNQI